MDLLFEYIEKNCDIGPDKKCPAKEFITKFNHYLVQQNISPISSKDVKNALDSTYKHKKFQLFNGFEGFEFKKIDELDVNVSPNVTNSTLLEDAKKNKNMNLAKIRNYNEKILAWYLNIKRSDFSTLRPYLPSHKIMYIKDKHGMIDIISTAKSMLPIVNTLKSQNKLYDAYPNDESQYNKIIYMLNEHNNSRTKLDIPHFEQIKTLFNEIQLDINQSIKTLDNSPCESKEKELFTQFKNLCCTNIPAGFSIQKPYMWIIYSKWYENYEKDVFLFIQTLNEITNNNISNKFDIKPLEDRLDKWNKLKLLLELH